MEPHNEKVAQAVQVLSEDHERKGYVTLDDLLALASRLGLEASDELLVRDGLACSGIAIETPNAEDAELNEAAAGGGSRLSRCQQIEHARIVQAGLRAAKHMERANFEELPALRGVALRGQGARNRMIESNLRLVGYVLKRFVPSHVIDRDDLFNEGVLGLHRAVERFDPDLGTHFSTYAVFWIRQALQRAQQNGDRTIRIPVHALQLLRKARRIRRALSLEGKRFTLVDVADQLGVEVERLVYLQHIDQEPMSLDGATPGDANTPLSSIVASVQMSPEEQLLALEERGAVLDAAASLSSKEHEVLCLRFGLVGEAREGLTLEEVGQQFGVTRERIRQIQEGALAKLRKRTLSNPLADYLEERGERKEDE